MAIHRLKLNSAYYNDSASGIKTFEIRKNDRNFQVGVNEYHEDYKKPKKKPVLKLV